MPAGVGAPASVVNVDALNGADISATWDDLLREDLTGKVGTSGDPRSSSTSQTAFLAWVYAHGGNAANLAPGVEYAKSCACYQVREWPAAAHSLRWHGLIAITWQRSAGGYCQRHRASSCDGLSR